MTETDEKLAKAFRMIGETNDLIERLGNVVLEQNKIIAEMQKDIVELKGGKHGNLNRNRR